MIKEGLQKKLRLNYIQQKSLDPNTQGLIFTEAPISKGLCIEQKLIGEGLTEAYIPICYIYPNNNSENDQEFSDKPYIKTVSDKLQTYIVTFEDYQDFIMLVDEAYDLLEAEKTSQKDTNEFIN